MLLLGAAAEELSASVLFATVFRAGVAGTVIASFRFMAAGKSALRRGIRSVEERFDLLKRRARRRLGRSEPVHILPFRGFAAERVIHLRGRVLEKEHESARDSDSLWDNIVRTLRRIESDEIPDAVVIAHFGSREVRVRSDEEGYFDLELSVPEPDGLGSELWQEIELELEERPDDAIPRATGEFLNVPDDAEFAVLSDIDDTILRTGAMSVLQKTRVVLFNNALTRSPFPGVAAFYHALQRGLGDEARNPIFYVSSSPWNFYDLFVDFLDHRGIPKGPLFLKDFGVDESKLFKSGHTSHKTEHVEKLLERFPRLRFLLVGDSGQKDAEIYRDLVDRHPRRIAGVYIREVGSAASRARVDSLLDEIREAGVPARLAPETETLAEHAAEQGWIRVDSLPEIRSSRSRDESLTS